MQSDNFGDWRIAHVTTLVNDVPPAYSGGPSHKAGTPIYISSILQHKALGYLGFVSPHPTALALSIAVKYSREANELQNGFSYKDIVTPWGKGSSIQDQELPLLYDFFENNMIVVAFSFQAIEAFTNSLISQHPDKKIRLKKGKEIIEMSASDAERDLSTGEKIAKVLPFLTGVPSPTGKKLWEDFKNLKKVRDTTIHFKSTDISTKYAVDTDSLYYYFFNNNPFTYVSVSYKIIKYFLNPKNYPRWFIEFQNTYGRELLL